MVPLDHYHFRNLFILGRTSYPKMGVGKYRRSRLITKATQGSDLSRTIRNYLFR